MLKVLTMLAVCSLTAAGIVGMYSINSMSTRLGAITVFMSVFSFALIMTTSAGMKDIFMATTT